MASSKVAAKPKGPIAGVIDKPTLSEQVQRIGGRLTPAQVSAFLSMADMGRPGKMIDLLHESRQRDGHLQNVLEIRELAVSGLRWDLSAPGHEASKKAKTAAEEARRALRACDGFRRFVAHCSGEGTCFGFAVSEIIWEKNEDGFMWPTRLDPVPCRRFGFRQKDGALVFLPRVDMNPDFGVNLAEKYPGKFLFYQPRVNGDVAAREGLARMLIWFALFRNWDIRDWLQLAELAWKPKVRGIYQPLASTEDQAILKQVVERYVYGNTPVHSSNVDVKVDVPPTSGLRGSSVHKELADFCGSEMSKGVLGTPDIVEAGPNGSRAATETRDGLRVIKRNNDAWGISDVINRQLLTEFTRINFGKGVASPEFQFITQDRGDPKMFAEAMQIIGQAGFNQIGTEFVKDQLGIPTPKPGEPVLEPPTKETPDGGKPKPDKK